MVKTLISEIFAANCYIVDVHHGVYIIDPCVGIKQIQNEITDKPILGIFITHGHADHFWGLKELSNSYEAPIYVHEKAIEKIENWKHNYSFLIKKPFSIKIDTSRYRFVDEGMMKIDDQIITIYYTPGHSDCSISILIGKSLFTGDTLFASSVGRTDLYTSNPAQLKTSLQKLKTLPNDIIIYPGHEESTTIGNEKNNNPYLFPS